MRENDAGQLRALILADATTSQKGVSIVAEGARLSPAMRSPIFVDQ
jgi:hypothetical protein